MNGSSATGNCANFSNNTSGTLTCADPTFSVLFDDPRGMPILFGLDGDMWVSQLLTIQTTASIVDITFDFRDTPGFSRVERVEMVMFNCPQWGIGVQTIQVLEHGRSFAITNPGNTSCDSLVRVCLPTKTTVPVFTLRFINSEWVYLAEVTFIGASATCLPNIVITAPSAPFTTTSSPPTTNQTPVPTSEETTSPFVTTKGSPSTSDIVRTNIVYTTVTTDESATMKLEFTTMPTKMMPKSTLKTTTVEVPNEQGSSIITAIIISSVFLLLLVVGVVVVVLVLRRCRHQHTAKEEASHTSSQTHTHPVVSLREETGQLQLQARMEKETSFHDDNQDDEEEDEMGEYSTIPKKKPPKTSIDDALVDLPQSQLYATINDSRKVFKEELEATQSTGQAAEISEENTTFAQVDVVVGKGGTTTQLYAQVNKKKKKSERADESILSSTKDEEIEMQCPVDQLYAQVDKKKKAVDDTCSLPQVTETSVDLTYAQVDDNMKGNSMSSVSLQ